MTTRVPDDGYYYVLYKGETVGRYRSLQQAAKRYKALLEESGYKPLPSQESEQDPVTVEDLEGFLGRAERYWSQSGKFRTGGGRLGPRPRRR